jgi:hypothetical protein
MGATRCPICSAPVPVSPGPGRPPTYCGPAHRRQAERLARAARNWAMVDPALGVVDLDVEKTNRAMNRMR